MTEFLAHMKQRKLVQWAIAYVAFVFALIQVVDVVAQQFGWPESVRRGLTLALAVGFFVVLVLAWYHGERGAHRVTGTELLILALLLAIGGGVLWRFAHVSRSAGIASTTRPSGRAAAALITATSSANAVPASVTPIAAIPIPAKSIAVLPFENLSTDKGNAYFADGMQDLILAGSVARGGAPGIRWSESGRMVVRVGRQCAGACCAGAQLASGCESRLWRPR